MSATVAYVVAKGKKELSRRVVRVEDGRIADTDPDMTADVTFTMTPELAADVESGALSIPVGFMRGAIKMAGDNRALLQVLPALSRAAGPATA